MQAGLVALVIGLAAQWWAYHSDLVFAFWDAQAHLDIARRVVDSVTPGLQMLGTVWLPVPHLLLSPLVQVDSWWWTGMAGSVVGLAAFLVIVVSVHDLLRQTVSNTALVWVGTLFVACNPSLLYLQTTAMTEPVLLAALCASVALLIRWRASSNSGTLWWAGVTAAMAVGSRYDAWFYVLLATPAVAWISARRHHSARAAVGDMMRFGVASAAFVLAWLLYNRIWFGDALAFQRGVWSAQAQQSALARQGSLPTANHPLVSLLVYLGAALMSAGPVITVLGSAGAVGLMVWRRSASLTLLLLAALPFNVLALIAGQTAIQLPWSAPAGSLNLRYGIMVLPGLAVALAIGADAAIQRAVSQRRGIVFACVLAVVLELGWFAARWPTHVGAVREAVAIRGGDPRQQHASDWLAGHYDGGRILVDEAVNLSPRTRIRMRDRVYRWTWQLGDQAIAQPAAAVDWVIADRRHAENAVTRTVSQPEFGAHFDRVWSDGDLSIWRRR